MKKKKMKKRRIKHNDLTAWFLEDHAALPAAYLASCNKFFNELKLSSREREGGPEVHKLASKNKS